LGRQVAVLDGDGGQRVERGPERGHDLGGAGQRRLHAVEVGAQERVAVSGSGAATTARTSGTGHVELPQPADQLVVCDLVDAVAPVARGCVDSVGSSSPTSW
jgi:hypothetical protein